MKVANSNRKEGQISFESKGKRHVRGPFGWN